MKNHFYMVALLAVSVVCGQGQAQQIPVAFNHKPQRQTIEVLVDGRHLTDFRYSPDFPKQVLYPIRTASGKEITRGYPLDPKPRERIDHYHHIGVWFNFGNVNGLDFWNNSPKVDPTKRDRYGTIVFRELVGMNPANGAFSVRADWADPKGGVLLEETTTYRFGGDAGIRTIERITELKAATEVTIAEHKEGLFGIRLALPLEEPSGAKAVRLDADGRETDEPAYAYTEGVTGRYRNANGDIGAAVWGKRSPWVALRGEVDGEPVTVAMIDHPGNYGYPAWSHARGYGLFAVNNFAGRAAGADQPEVKIVLKPGDAMTFRHLLVMGGDLSDETLDKLARFE